MRMIRLLDVEAAGGKKSAGRLDASEGGEDFCWMLFQLSARSLSPSLFLFLSATHTHTHTHTHSCFFKSHVAACVHPNAANLPQALKSLERL